MQPHRFGHLRAEPAREPQPAEFLMLVVNAVLGRILAQIVDHVADVVQQARRDQRGVAAGLLGEPCRLQRVRPLIDRRETV